MTHKDKEPIPVADNPCNTCPYRKDCPSGLWAASEYEKLPHWDAPGIAGATSDVFMCHSQHMGGKQAGCRGWLDTALQHNIGTRILEATGRFKWNQKLTDVPLYESGAEAAAAGMRDIEKPGDKANVMITKLVKAQNLGRDPHAKPVVKKKTGAKRPRSE